MASSHVSPATASSAPPQSEVPLDTHLPLVSAGLSYWHRSTRAFHLLHEQQHESPPPSARYVIVGAGLTGALVAYKLVERGVLPSEIVILEAREAVSGSTGRNAGHVRPDAFRSFSVYSAVHGPDQAMEIVATETRNLSLINDFVRRHDIRCDFALTSTFDVCLSPAVVEDVEANIKDFLNAGGKLGDLEVKCWYGDEAKHVTGCVDALAAFEWPAASIHPAKLVHWILNHVVEQGVRLYTHCPVTNVAANGAYWDVTTTRGPIRAEKVFHCTNAYAGSLLEQMDTARLTPLAVQVFSIIPPPCWTGHSAFKKTMAIRESPAMFYGLAQMPSDGTIVVSVGRPIKMGVQAEDDHSPENGQVVLNRLKELFTPETDVTLRYGEGVDCSWSGLIAFTPDKVPYVGEVAGLPGQYVCAGFNGHGMANIFSCADGVVSLVLGQSWEDTRLPACYRSRPDNRTGT